MKDERVKEEEEEEEEEERESGNKRGVVGEGK